MTQIVTDMVILWVNTSFTGVVTLWVTSAVKTAEIAQQLCRQPRVEDILWCLGPSLRLESYGPHGSRGADGYARAYLDAGEND